MTTFVATMLMLGVLIFVHELGHYLAAKSVDVEVEKFSIGFGPKLIGFQRDILTEKSDKFDGVHRCCNKYEGNL